MKRSLVSKTSKYKATREATDTMINVMKLKHSNLRNFLIVSEFSS